MNKLLLFLMVIAMIAWGETWISAKILGHYLDTWSLIFWRFAIAGSALLGVVLMMKLSLKTDLKDVFIAFVSATVLIFYNLAFFTGTSLAPASFGGVLVTTLTPIITFFILAVLNKKNLTKSEYIGLLLGFAGMFFMLRIWTMDIGFIFSKGTLYYLLASVLWPVLSIISSKHNTNALVFSVYLFLFTAVIVGCFKGFNVGDVLSFDFNFWFNLLILSLFGTTFATTVYFITAVKHGSKTANSFFFLVPSAAIFFGMICLKENINPSLIIGGMFSIAGVYIINLKAFRADSKTKLRKQQV